MRTAFFQSCGFILSLSLLAGCAAHAEPPATAPDTTPASVPPTAAAPQLTLDAELERPAGAAGAKPTSAPPEERLTPTPPPRVSTASGAPLAQVARQMTIDDSALFPRYPSLEPRVQFWTRVFGEYSELQSAIHAAEYPHIVFEVLDFRDEAAYMNRFVLDKVRREQEENAKAAAEMLLAAVHAKRHTPEKMHPEERRVYQLFADIQDDQKFAKAKGTVRAQRGIRERTQKALQVSGKYLPEMERIFRNYDLPVRLTRLPLVESSFNVDAYSKVGAAGLWQFIPSSAKMYMRLDDLVDDRRDPWFSTEAAARHLRDDYKVLKSWPLALTAYNHGRGGIARGMAETGARDLSELIERYRGKAFGFASKNFYAEFLAASDVERNYRAHFGEVTREPPLEFEIVETRHYVPYETLRRLCGADDEMFRKLNPSYRPEVIEGKLYVPPGHLIRVPAGSARSFEVAYARLGTRERFDSQRAQFLLHRVQRGDTLSGLARKYDVSVATIARANGMKSSRPLRVGQVLKVPPHTETRPGPIAVAVGESKPAQTRSQKLEQIAEQQAAATGVKSKRESAKSVKVKYRTHKVRAGQTLSGIANRYDVSVAELQAANGLGKSALIRPGMKLKVPVKS